MSRAHPRHACGALLALLLPALTPAPAHAQGPSVPGAAYGSWLDAEDRSAEEAPREFTLINYFFTRASVTNQVGDPAGLKGVSLGPIGQVVGSAVRVNGGREASYVEQRWIPVVEYTPWFVDGLAAFRAQFEVDYVWGRSANTVQQNEGGGLNADQINIQTKNVNVTLYPTRRPSDLAIVLGTQSVYDSPYESARTPLGDIIRTGYKLTYLGTDATGIAIYSQRYGPAKLSLLPLGSAQAGKALRDDPRLKFAWLGTADYAYQVQPGTLVGGSVWHLRDSTEGQAYAFEGLVNSGPSSNGLGAYTGVPRFDLDRANGNVTWLGVNFHHNLDFRTSRFAASGFAMYNFGRYTSTGTNATALRQLDISGLGANLEGVYNWGSTANDVLSLEALVSTGDPNLGDGKYTGAFTMNQYGLPGAVWFNHRTLLLFPFTSTINNYTGAVTDISNQGYGLRTLIASAAWDIVPHKLNLKLGAATAVSGVAPPPTPEGIARGKGIGTEVNVELRYTLRFLMTAGLHAGYMKRGSFYDGNTRVTADPWAVFTTYTWYAF